MPILYVETDAASACAPAPFCSANLLAALGAVGRAIVPYGAGAGVLAATLTLNGNEGPVIGAMLEVSPTTGPNKTRLWVATGFVFGFHVTSPNPYIGWVRSDICHVTSGCVSVESLAVDTNPVNLGPSDKDYVTKFLTLNAATPVVVQPGDRIVVLLSFVNNSASPQSLGWTPDQVVACTDWDPESGVEMMIGRRKRQQQLADDEALQLLLGTEEVWE